jgi:hypothetical protein
MTAGTFVSIVVSTIVVLAVLAALFPELNAQLSAYAGVETLFGPILVIVVPILLGAAVILWAIREYRLSGE